MAPRPSVRLPAAFPAAFPALLPAALLAALLAAPLPAGAEVLPGDPCVPDVARFCAHVTAGGGRLMTCLHRHDRELAPACKARVDADYLAAQETVEEIVRACRADAADFCADVQPGNGRMLSCLDDHAPKLSGPCQAEVVRITAARAQVQAIAAACKADVARLCPTTPPEADLIVQCLQVNRERLSRECDAGGVQQAARAAEFVHRVEEGKDRERTREMLQIIQGLDTVAFSRSQVLIQLDAFESMGGKGNAGRLLLNPQVVFGARSQFALQVKIPVVALYPSDGASAQFGLGAVNTALSWNFFTTGRLVHFAALGIQWQTASSPLIGAPWALIPSYAVGAPLAHWLTLTVQLQWVRSLGSQPGYRDASLLVLEPILAANLPGRSYVAIDSWMAWDFTNGTFAPTLKGIAGIFTDRQRSLSISAWYQATLTRSAADTLFRYDVGMALAYYFDW